MVVVDVVLVGVVTVSVVVVLSAMATPPAAKKAPAASAKTIELRIRMFPCPFWMFLAREAPKHEFWP